MAFHASLRAAHQAFLTKTEEAARQLVHHHLASATSEFALNLMASMPDFWVDEELGQEEGTEGQEDGQEGGQENAAGRQVPALASCRLWLDLLSQCDMLTLPVHATQADLGFSLPVTCELACNVWF